MVLSIRRAMVQQRMQVFSVWTLHHSRLYNSSKA